MKSWLGSLLPCSIYTCLESGTSRSSKIVNAVSFAKTFEAVSNKISRSFHVSSISILIVKIIQSQDAPACWGYWVASVAFDSVLPLHCGRCPAMLSGSRYAHTEVVGWSASLRPDTCQQLEIDLEMIIKHALKKSSLKFKSILFHLMNLFWSSLTHSKYWL